ncbi:hypothetical protein TYRP_016183 [Tyrophagus putrescentiae]|nr:hypothetical protein TYRP_016183 [Tyrophagus putrescentiae]
MSAPLSISYSLLLHVTLTLAACAHTLLSTLTLVTLCAPPVIVNFSHLSLFSFCVLSLPPSGHFMFITCPFRGHVLIFCLVSFLSLFSPSVHALRSVLGLSISPEHLLLSPCLQSCVERFLCHTFSNKPLSRRHQANRPSPGLPLFLPSTAPSRRTPSPS